MLDVIQESYHNVTRQVEFTLNLSDTDYITASYYNNCSGKFEKNEICENVEMGKFYQFKIELTLSKKPQSETFVRIKDCP